ncbi:hypothetical protein V8C37DRAFT_419977 [Trichoderma ceciliae]
MKRYIYMSFGSSSARWQHFSNSSRHNVCTNCYHAPDFQTLDELETHWVVQHDWCSRCDEFFDDLDDLEQHRIDEHNKCLTCGGYFSSPSNLRYHRLTHAEKNIECFGCYRTFATKSAMVLHLEVGNCPSAVGREDVDRIARLCHQAIRYIDGDGDYVCPTCSKYFRFMSGLLQHAESDSCGESLRKKMRPLSVFLRFLETRVGWVAMDRAR